MNIENIGIPKIHLSAEEAELIGDSKWILTKHNVIKKVYMLFGEMNEVMKNEIAALADLLGDVNCLNGKISRGESYQLLPYVILDYPSSFNKNNIFAIRTMFWWGNFFSITLHISGDNKIKFIHNTPETLFFLKKNNFFICVNSEEWQHDFEEKNYLPAAKFTDNDFECIIKQPFFKVAKQLSVKHWDEAPDFILNGFKEILKLLQINFQGGKKDLLSGFPITGSDL